MTGNTPQITTFSTPRVIPTGPVWQSIACNQVSTGGDGHWWELVGLNPDGSEAWLEVEPPIGGPFWFWNGSCYTGCYLSRPNEDISRFINEQSQYNRRGPRAMMQGHHVSVHPQKALPPVVGPPKHWYQSPWMFLWLLLGIAYNLGVGAFGWSQRDPARNDQWVLWFVPETVLFGWVFFVGAIIAAVRHVKPHSAVARWGYGLLAGAVAAKVAVDHHQAQQYRDSQEEWQAKARAAREADRHSRLQAEQTERDKYSEERKKYGLP